MILNSLSFMSRNIVFKLLSLCGRLLFPIYKVIRFIPKYTRILNSQIVKYSLSKPYPRVLFLGRKVNIVGPKSIVLGNRVKIDSYSTISTWHSKKYNPLLQIGDCTEIGAFAHITCINKVSIGRNVLIGKFVTITDNSHGGNTFAELDVPPSKRELYSKGEVAIDDNVWIGDKVTVLPNIKIGKGAIIGANSVVTRDIPPFVIACGNPLRIINIQRYE